ncbi:unnamed protein product [Closterium sp. NIES-54]
MLQIFHIWLLSHAFTHPPSSPPPPFLPPLSLPTPFPLPQLLSPSIIPLVCLTSPSTPPGAQGRQHSRLPAGSAAAAGLKDGDSIADFLRAVQQQLAPDFREVRSASVEGLVYIKEDLIIPHVSDVIIPHVCDVIIPHVSDVIIPHLCDVIIPHVSGVIIPLALPW